MNKPRQYLLARSAGTGDHDGGISLGHLARQLQQLGGARIPVHQGMFIHPLWRHIAGHLIKQHLWREGFGQIIDGPLAHGTHSAVDVGVGGHQQHRHIGVLLANITQQGMTIHPPHLDIGDHHVISLTPQLHQRRLGTVGLMAVVTGQHQGVDNGLTQTMIIFHDENSRLAHTLPPATSCCSPVTCKGKRMVKHVPSPTTEATSILP